MYSLSRHSERVLSTCDPRWRIVVYKLLERFDVKALYGFRGEKLQNALYYGKPQRSKKKWPDSKHNINPSPAIDLAPYPIDWGAHDNPRDNIRAMGRFYNMAGRIDVIASNLGFEVRWGGDWDGDNDYFDQSFDDLGHFEFIDR